MAFQAAPTQIVADAQVMDPAAIKQENWTFSELYEAFRDLTGGLQWLARRSLIANSRICEVCGRAMTLIAHEKGNDKKRWSCRPCDRRVAVRKGSFFERSSLDLHQIVKIIYYWSFDQPQSYTLHELKLGNNTVIDWYNFCRDECQRFVEENQEIGGIDEDGNPIIVEIDESLYFHRKYHRGHYRAGHWVFGGCERGTGKCFLVEVPDRTGPTLQAEIVRHILPGSHIMSDGWAAYANISDIDHGVYMHSVVIHERHFVNPDDPLVHTQNIENMWMRAKRKLKRQFGTSRALFPSYLHEFAFRNAQSDKDLVFGAILARIAESYRF